MVRWRLPNERRKYGNKPVTLRGVKFHSSGEGDRWEQLRLLEKAGEILDLQRQIPFRFVVNSVEIGKYVADFTYLDNGVHVVEDFKSKATITELYRWKKKLMKAIYGIDILESGRNNRR